MLSHQAFSKQKWLRKLHRKKILLSRRNLIVNFHKMPEIKFNKLTWFERIINYLKSLFMCDIKKRKPQPY